MSYDNMSYDIMPPPFPSLHALIPLLHPSCPMNLVTSSCLCLASWPLITFRCPMNLLVASLCSPVHYLHTPLSYAFTCCQLPHLFTCCQLHRPPLFLGFSPPPFASCSSRPMNLLVASSHALYVPLTCSGFCHLMRKQQARPQHART